MLLEKIARLVDSIKRKCFEVTEGHILNYNRCKNSQKSLMYCMQFLKIKS